MDIFEVQHLETFLGHFRKSSVFGDAQWGCGGRKTNSEFPNSVWAYGQEVGAGHGEAMVQLARCRGGNAGSLSLTCSAVGVGGGSGGQASLGNWATKNPDPIRESGFGRLG